MYELIGLFKEEIFAVYGQEIKNAKECKTFANAVAAATNRPISVTTMKRFFNVIESPHKSSKYTLDTLSMFLGFENWQTYLDNYEKKHPEDKEPWELLKLRISDVTRDSLSAIEKRVSKNGYLIKRQFAIRHCQEFLDSDKLVTAFIAPEGYGKSTLLVQLVKLFVPGKETALKNDIVCLIDGKIFYQLTSKYPLSPILQQLIDFEYKTSHSYYFRLNPEKVKGRLIVLIDDVDEVFTNRNKFYNFADNLMQFTMSHHGTQHFKLILTLKPNNMLVFNSLVKTHPALKEYWFGVNFDADFDEQRNVPLLNNKEIKEFLRNNNFRSFEKLRFLYREIIPLIRFPYLLSLIDLDGSSMKLNEFKVMRSFIDNKVFKTPFWETRNQLIFKYITHSNYGLKPAVRKELIAGYTDSTVAYRDLLSAGVFQEYLVHENHLSPVMNVKFVNKILEGYFLTLHWLDKKLPTFELLNELEAFYPRDSPVLPKIIQNIIHIAFADEDLGMIKQILQFQSQLEGRNSTPSNVSLIGEEITVTLESELRRNRKMRTILMPFLAKSEIGRLVYFDRLFDLDSLVLFSEKYIDLYLISNPSIEAQINGNFLKFMKGHLISDPEQCRCIYELFLTMDLNTIDDQVYRGFYLYVLITYQGIYLKQAIEPKLIQLVHAQIKFFEFARNEKSIHDNDIIFLVVFALCHTGCFKEAVEIAESASTQLDSMKYKNNPYFKLFQLYHSYALLKLKRQKEALALYQKVKFDSIPSHMYFYLQIRIEFINAEFLFYQNRKEKAMKKINTILRLCKMLKYELLHEKALKLIRDYSSKPA